MEFKLENLKGEEILHKLINTVADQAPFGGGFINYLVDTVLFPKAEVDLWSQMEGKVAGLMESRLDEMMSALGTNAASNLLARLRAFGNQFRQLRYLTDREERKTRIAFMLTQIDAAVAECTALPNAHLLAAAEVLRPLALAHVALLMEQKSLEPHRYEHQAALNHAAIMYSRTAASLFDRAMAWRLAMIASGNGTLVMTDLNVSADGRTKRVEIAVYDRFANNVWQPGTHGMSVFRLSTGTVYADRVSPEFEATKEAAYTRLTAYAEDVKKKYTELWNDKLLTFTQAFMKLVDWEGMKRDDKGEFTAERRVRTFPVVPSPHRSAVAGALERLDLFLEQQMDQFTLSGPRYVQTYRLPADALTGEHASMHYRADTYDTAVACIYFQERGQMDRARDLGDALVAAMNHDALGGGRIVAATRADELLDRGLGLTTSIFHHDGGRRDVGNMSWAGLALTRLYHRTGRYRYLHAAETIGGWIVANCGVDDAWGGFSGGQDHWGNVYPWRSVEHNVDAFSLFANLHHLTGEARWAGASESARRLVIACRVEKPRNEVYYVTGTGETMVLNDAVVPTDTQSWTALAGIAPGAMEGYSLLYMAHNMDAASAGFAGTRFARDGKEVQNEATAGAAMALWLTKSNLRHMAERYYDSLLRQIEKAPNADGYGVVATPAPLAETGPGLGWGYYNFLHVASSAWTGLALLAREDPGANPYAALTTVRKA
ncbi:MAG TPA: hypothetical protein VFH27_15525 [Longimicrobiaceae bacterium]|nr:hypothetical protein [Longimicrobiaceae bacterium]